MTVGVRRYRMLAADTPTGAITLRNVFGESMDVIYASSLDDAIRRLGDDIDIIVCGIHFDDSRMFDLLRMTKAVPAARRIPFVCYRDLDTDLGQTVLEGLEIATKALGAAAFIDVYTLKRRYGVVSTDDHLREVVAAQLPGAE